MYYLVSYLSNRVINKFYFFRLFGVFHVLYNTVGDKSLI